MENYRNLYLRSLFQIISAETYLNNKRNLYYCTLSQVYFKIVRNFQINAWVLARKLELMMFSWNWEIRPKVATRVDDQTFFLLQPIECEKMPFWESNISKNDINNTNKSTLRNVLLFFIINVLGIWNRNSLY